MQNQKDELVVLEDSKIELIEKIDPDTFFAQMEAKAAPIDSNVANCDRRTIVDGKSSCYFFDNGKSYYPFCIKDCWTNKNLWKERVRL
jgi:hypothetical protein